MKKSETLAILWFLFMIVSAVAAPFILSARAQEMNFSRLLDPPSMQNWFGTDSLGRDLFARVLCASRVSLGVSISAVLIAVFVGTWIGAAAGYFGGLCDRILMGWVNVMLCFPVFFLILAVISVLQPSVLNLMIVLGLTGWMGTARLVRSEVLSLKEREFILASRVSGAGPFWILSRHLIPNAAGPVIVSSVLGVSAAILTESGLSFLGIGVQPPTPSWGNILTDGKAALGAAWWLLFFPGLMIFLTVLSANILGEKLSDRLSRQKVSP